MSTLTHAHLTPPGRTVAGAESKEASARPEDGVVIRRVQGDRPEKLLFGAIQDPTVRIKMPISVSVSVHDGAVVVHAEDLNEFGYGDSLSSALADLGKTLAELFHSLQNDRDRLGPELTKVHETLLSYVERRAGPDR